MKKTVCALISVILAFGVFFTASAGEDASVEIGVKAFEGSDAAVRLWTADDDTRYLFLPSDCSDEETTLVLSGSDSVEIDGETLADGDSASILTEGAHELTYGGVTHSLVVLRSANIPSVWITTESGSSDYITASKNNKEPGTFTLASGGEILIDGAALSSIKGRGNSTWMSNKKPWNVKFDKKTDVLGMGKAKKWTLLANHFDASLLRNSLALNIAEALGMAYTPSYRMIDLYLNGEYQGNYLIVESVEIGETRVNITDLEDLNEAANPDIDVEKARRGGVNSSTTPGSRKWVNIASPDDVSGGYLIETEIPNRYGSEVSGFVTDHGQCVILKSPEYASKDEVDYIADLVSDAEQALYSEDGYNDKGVYYADYFDIESLVKAYILTEFTFHRDAGQSSCYFYKDAGESLLHAGPAWDFDLSMGNARYAAGLLFSVTDASSWWANAVFYNYEEGQTLTVFNLAYRHEDFREKVSEAWASLRGNIASELAKLPAMTDEAAPSAVMNAVRWKLFTGKTAEEKEEAYRKSVKSLSDFTAKRLSALDGGFSGDSAMVYLDANGGDGLLTNGVMLRVGDSFFLPELKGDATEITAPENCVFKGWSEQKSGGEIYRPFDSFRLKSKTTVFYAQWAPLVEEPSSEELSSEPASEEPQSEEQSTKTPVEPGTVAPDEPSTAPQESTTASPAEPTTKGGEPVSSQTDVTTAPEKPSDEPSSETESTTQEPESTTKRQEPPTKKHDPPTEPTGLRGDADLDGKVTAKDARIVLRTSAKLCVLTDHAFTLCDLNSDGRLTASEARKILRFSAKLEKTI